MRVDPRRPLARSLAGACDRMLDHGLERGLHARRDGAQTALVRGYRRRLVAQAEPVMGENVQVCWEKFCRYWDVEARTVPMEGDRFHLDAASAVAVVDENTIGVVAILGS